MGMAAARKQEVSFDSSSCEEEEVGREPRINYGGGGSSCAAKGGAGRRRQPLCRALLLLSSLCIQTAIRNTRVRNLLWPFWQSTLSSTALSSGVCHRCNVSDCSGQEAASSAASFTSIPSESAAITESLWVLMAASGCVYVIVCVCTCVCVHVWLCAM